jgi:hypothetical protein
MLGLLALLQTHLQLVRVNQNHRLLALGLLEAEYMLFRNSVV